MNSHWRWEPGESDLGPGSDRHWVVRATHKHLMGTALFRFWSLMFLLCLGLTGARASWAQSQNPSPKELAALNEPAHTESATTNTTAPATPPNPAAPVTPTAPAKAESPNELATASDSEFRAAVARQFEEMQKQIEELQAELKEARNANAQLSSSLVAASANSASPPADPGANQNQAPPAPAAIPQAPAANAAPAKIVPFSDWDWTWLNGNPRNKDTAFDTPFFTPEIRADLTYTYDFNKPADNSMGGSSELFRANELQLEQLGIGGDFHWNDVRARFMTQFGMYSTATIRNDPSYAKGQWDIADADRYLSEAYGGYHLNVMHGINIDAGIFMSYIGLFSYYNFDNWAYQPSYVSSNTPWFFQGVRIQIFPTAHLKIEPWIINGWQSYASSNSRKGIGGQLKWTPYPWLNIISNNYGVGHDDLYVPHRTRIHTDNSIEVKYYDHPDNLGLDKMAISLTGDIGCEWGEGVSCHGNTAGGPKQSFIGYMVYDRFWFHKDLFGLTIGGGQINNPGRYLVLLPPINGESAASAAANAPYFTGNPGDPFKAWDSSVTFDYMPRQYLTFRFEGDYRYANVPYWSGPGGVTPPSPVVGGGYLNNGNPVDLVCANGADSTVAGNVESGSSLVAANNACVNMGDALGGPKVSYSGSFPAPNSTSYPGLWFPDLRRDEMLFDVDLMVKF